MSIFLEQPWFVGICGGLLTICFIGAWLQSGIRWLLWVGLGLVTLTVGLLLLENYVVTDREAVTARVHHIARVVEQNDAAQLEKFVHSRNPELKQRIRAESQRYKISRVVVKRNLTVEVKDGRSAVAEFNVVVIGSTISGDLSGRAPVRAKVEFLLEDGQWQVFDYDYGLPHQELPKYPVRR